MIQIWNKIRRGIFRVNRLTALLILFRAYSGSPLYSCHVSWCGTIKFTVSYPSSAYGLLCNNCNYLTTVDFIFNTCDLLLFGSNDRSTQQPNFLKQCICLEQCEGKHLKTTKAVSICNFFFCLGMYFSPNAYLVKQASHSSKKLPSVCLPS